MAWQIGKTLDAIAVPLTALATVAIGIFPFTLKSSTDNLWNTAKDQIRDADRALQITQRAYLAVDSNGVYPFGSAAEVPHSVAQISVRNVGRLPARKVSCFIAWGMSPQ